MLTDSQLSAVREFAQFLYNNELAYHREHRPELLAKMEREEPGKLAEFRAKCDADALTAAEQFTDTDKLLDRVRRGALHPSNRHYRALFTGLTGCRLPATAGGTREAVRQYIGADRFDAYYAALEADREAQERARHDAQESKGRAAVERMAETVKAGRPIDGDSLATLARSLGFDLHPRTVGTLRKRVVSIGPDGGRVTGRGFLPDTIWRLYREVREKLAGTAAA